MALIGFLRIEGIEGESKDNDHRDEINIIGMDWDVSSVSGAQRGLGRTKSRAEVSALTVQKFFDAASPYLALACMQGKAFPEVVLTLRKDSGDAPLDYLIITLTNMLISDYQVENEGKDATERQLCEYVGLTFETIKIRYIVQAEDHSAGDEHEIEYDVVDGSAGRV